MREDFPDYKGPIFAFFRALAIWSGVLIVGGVVLGVVQVLFHTSVWVFNAFFIAMAGVGLIVALIPTLGTFREEERAKAAAGKRAPPATPSIPTGMVAVAKLAMLAAGLLWLPLLVAGLLAHLAALSIVGAALAGLSLGSVCLLLPGREAWRSRRKRG